MLIQLNIEAIRAHMRLTRQQMAEKMGISQDRYNRLASGETKMLAKELIKLHKISGIPYELIDVLN